MSKCKRVIVAEWAAFIFRCFYGIGCFFLSFFEIVTLAKANSSLLAMGAASCLC